MYKDKEKQNNYQKIRVRNRRIKFLGGKLCEHCGSKNNIEIHHLDKKEKITHRIWTYKEDFILNELKKCIILCRKCHRKIHDEERHKKLKHGTWTLWANYKCRCPECTKFHSNELRKYREKKRMVV